MSAILEVCGRRHRIRHNSKDYYLFVSDKSIMFHGPGESTVQFQEEFAMLNLVCRLVSKARKNGMPWGEIVRQFHSVDVTGGRTMVKQIVECLETIDG